MSHMPTRSSSSSSSKGFSMKFQITSADGITRAQELCHLSPSSRKQEKTVVWKLRRYMRNLILIILGNKLHTTRIVFGLWIKIILTLASTTAIKCDDMSLLSEKHVTIIAFVKSIEKRSVIQRTLQVM